jgi:predicted ATP-grasp superfamily ATP-dependent carboligase
LIGQRVREKLAQEFTRQGITAEYLTAAIKNGVDLASKPIVIGEDIHDYPDYAARLSYLNTLLKLMDAFPSDKLELSAETYEERIMRLHSQSQASPDAADEDAPDNDIATDCTIIESTTEVSSASLPDIKDNR